VTDSLIRARRAALLLRRRPSPRAARFAVVITHEGTACGDEREERNTYFQQHQSSPRVN
jgi:hypothetical protein